MFLLWFRPFSSSFPAFCSGGWGRGCFSFPPTRISQVDESKQHEQSGQLWPENVSGDLYLQKNERWGAACLDYWIPSEIQKKKKKSFLFFFCICGEQRAWYSDCPRLRCTSPNLIPVFLYRRQQVIKGGSIYSDQSAHLLCMFFTALPCVKTYVPNCAFAVAPWAQSAIRKRKRAAEIDVIIQQHHIRVGFYFFWLSFAAF